MRDAGCGMQQGARDCPVGLVPRAGLPDARLISKLPSRAARRDRSRRIASDPLHRPACSSIMRYPKPLLAATASLTLLLPGHRLPARRTPAWRRRRPLDPGNLDPRRQTRATTSTSSPMAAGCRRTRSRPSIRAGAPSRNSASATTPCSTKSSTKARPAAAPAGPTEQKVGDFYATGMDEARVDADGVKPLAAEFDAHRRPQGRAPNCRRKSRTCKASAWASLFRLDVDSDEKNSTLQIAQGMQGGLALPDRDYYTKDDDRSKTIRAAVPGTRRQDAHPARATPPKPPPPRRRPSSTSKPISPRPARRAWTCATRKRTTTR